jgi:hypothetical protein
MLHVALNLKDAILEYYDNYPDNAYAGDGGRRKHSERHTQTLAKWRLIISQSPACQPNPN